MHYQRARAGTPMDMPHLREGKKICKVPGCDKPHRAKGFCTMHYFRLRRGQSMDKPRKDEPAPNVSSPIENEIDPHWWAKGTDLY